MKLVNPLILVDGSQYLFRAYNAMPDMRNSKGFPTNAIRGVVSMLRKLVRENPTATVAVVFDAPGKTFRDEMFAEYKANRPPMEDDLRVQIQPIHDFVKAMGLPLIIEEGVEADDVMGTLAAQATATKRDALISSSDKDLAQLVTEHVLLQDSMSDTTLDRDGVFEKFEVHPEQIIDYLALMGDKVDNIPGIPGVGKKTAAKWLQEHGDLDTVIATADQVKGKIGEKLRANLDVLPLSRKLATIKCDVEMTSSVDNIEQNPIDYSRLYELCDEYDFRTLREQFAEDSDAPALSETEPEPVQIEKVATVVELHSIVNRLVDIGTATVFAVMTPLNAREYSLHALGLCGDATQAWYIPCVSSMAEQNLDANAALQQLKGLFENDQLTLITHDGKLLRHMLRSFDIELRANVEDVMLMSYVLNSIGHGEHQLRGIAGTLLNRTIQDSKDLLGTGAKRIGYDAVDPTELEQYTCEQVTTIHAVHEAMVGRLNKAELLKKVYKDIEVPLEPYLWGMEWHGAKVDPLVLESLREELETRKDQLVLQAHELVGHEFNLGSPKQLETVLYDELKLDPPKASKSGARSTKEEVLSGLTSKHALPQVILDYRATTKLISTYIAGLTREIDPVSERVHTSFSQANASTGRLASVNPNLQNIPIRTPDGRRVREAFVAPSGHVLLTADYSQIELRVMAHITDDPGLSEAFNNRVDIHQATAAEVFRMPLEMVDEEQRRSAKAINFGLMYGMSAFGLSRNLGISPPKASEYIAAYFSRYPHVENYVQATKEHGHQNGYVETIFGRRIYLRDINARNHVLRQAAERLAINAPVQGSAADIIKLATIRVGDWLKQANLDIIMILQVHDELVFEVAEQHLAEAQERIPELMQSAVDLKVPLEVDVGIATNWSAAH